MKLFEHSHWLWDHRYDRGENVYLDFWEQFPIETLAEHYTFYISADAQYAVYVNGVLASFGQWSDYENHKVYDTVDLTPYLQTGDNEICVTVHGIGRNFSTYRAAQPGVIYSLYADDRLFIISSEDTFVSPNPSYTKGPVETVSGQLGFTYRYDATAKTSPSDRRRADIVQKPMPTGQRPVQKLTVGEDKRARICAQGVFIDSRMEGLTLGQRVEYAFLSTRELYEMTGAYGNPCFIPREEGIPFRGEQFDNMADGIFAVMDLGEESAGILSLDIDVPKDTEILIGWGEHLDDLRPRSYVGGRNFAIRYRAHAGRNTFAGPFLRLGLRYLQLNIYADNCRLYYAGIKPTDYPLDHTPTFRCADHLHNKIYEVSRRTLAMCMHEHYEDCPWREQALYSMDSRNQMLCGYYVFGEKDFARESLRLMAQSLREDGMLELCSPAVVSITIPSFTAVFIPQLAEYLLYTGDVDFIREMLPTARAIIGAFLARLDNSERLLKCYGEAKYWNFYEWQEGLAGVIGGTVAEEDRTYDAPLNAFFSMALRSMVTLEEACGHGEEALFYAEEKASLDDRIDHFFWDRETGAYASFVHDGEKSHYSELTNSLILYAGIGSEPKRDSVMEALVEKRLIPVTISHSIYKYEVLLQKPGKYAKWVFEEIARVWGDMLYKGATTFYETEEGADAFGLAGSLCHGWSAIPTYFYYAYVLGLKPTANGFASYEIKPVDAGIYGASGTVVTPVGKIVL